MRIFRSVYKIAAAVLFVFLCISSSQATTYHLSPTGSDSNSGTSGSPWATPNHNVNCGDVLIAATGAYSPFGSFGTVSSCGTGSAQSVAWLECATAFACTISGTSGNDISMNKSNWGVQGFLLSGNSSTYCIQSFNNGTTIHHIIIANNICNQGGAGFQAVFNIDYWVVVGNIVYNAAQGSGSCNSAISPYELADFDTLTGTHIFIAGNFTWNNVEPSTCSGGKPTDGEGIIVDTLDGSQGGRAQYDQQVAVENNIVLANGGRGIEVFNNSAGTNHAHIFLNHNTSWGNGTDANQQFTPCGEFQFGSAFNITETADLAVTNKSACLFSGTNNFYDVLMENGNGTNSVTGNWFYSPFSLNTFLFSSPGFSYGTNTFTNPSLSSPSDPAAPSCSGQATTAACMATVISNFRPTASGTSSYGYQTSPSTTDSLFPAWLCNVNLPVSNIPTNCSGSVTTFYISYSSGSNSNPGTKTSPWKSHPYMQTGASCAGAAPTFTHVAGDTFIFKQGDSWPNACFDMTVSNGGTSGNPDVYTFDPTWGTAGGTSGSKGQNVGTYQFTAGGSVINGTDGFNRFIVVNASNVTFNGMELTGMTWTGSPSYGNAQGIYEGGNTNIIVSNIYAHGWTHSGATSDVLSWIVGFAGSPYNAGDQVTGSVFDGTGASDSGEAVYLIPNLDNNIVRNMTNGLLPNANAVVHDNTVGPINQSFDASDHENCFEPLGLFPGVTSTNYFYNNVFHDCYAVGILTQGGAASSGIEIDYLWDNVAWTGAQSTIPFNFDSVSTSNNSSAVYAWNNTIYGGSLVCMRSTNRGNGNYGILNVQNNHCISDTGLSSFAVGGNTQTIGNNTVMGTATAASQGYTATQTYAYSPTSITNGTVGQGVNLTSSGTGALATLLKDTTYGGSRITTSRPASGAWDSGAYQQSSSPPPPPPSGLRVIVIQ